LKARLTKTDNDDVNSKVNLRKVATAGMEEIKVLDLFAGENTLWQHFDKKKYYGIELTKGKGNNLNGNNLKAIPGLDLSEFNVIDCDSYGIPIKQIEAIHKNATLRPGTIVIYTAIGGPVSGINKESLRQFNMEAIYKKCKFLLNKESINLFHGYLYTKGIRTVVEYRKRRGVYDKCYGYYKVNT